MIIMLIFVVARSRLGRYEELRRQFGNWPDVSIVLDRREGERRTLPRTFSGVDRRGAERRHRLYDLPYLKLGWSVADMDELAS